MSEPKYIGQSLYIAIRGTLDDGSDLNLSELDNFAIILKKDDKIFLFASKNAQNDEIVFVQVSPYYYYCKVADTIVAKFVEGAYDLEVGIISTDNDITTFKLISKVSRAVTFVNNLMYKKLS